MSENQEQAGSRSRSLPWWWIVLPWLAFVLAGFLYWLWRQRQTNPIQPVRIDLSFIRRPAQSAPAVETPAQPAAPVVEEAAESPASSLAAAPAGDNAPAEPDDLTAISGIGPKIAVVLKAAGIDTFARLAEIDPQSLLALLKDANVRLADPSSWPEQARLAAAGKWDELKALIANLRARRAASTT